MKNGLPAFIVLTIFLIIPICYAISPLPLQIYGSATIDGNPAPAGTEITAYGNNGIECGKGTIKDTGTFGVLSCNGDDASTEETEGALPGDTISIKINGITAKTDQNIKWRSGRYIEVSALVETGKITPQQEEAAHVPYMTSEPRITLGTILEGLAILSFIALPIAVILLLRKIAREKR